MSVWMSGAMNDLLWSKTESYAPPSRPWRANRPSLWHSKRNHRSKPKTSEGDFNLLRIRQVVATSPKVLPLRHDTEFFGLPFHQEIMKSKVIWLCKEGLRKGLHGLIWNGRGCAGVLSDRPSMKLVAILV